MRLDRATGDSFLFVIHVHPFEMGWAPTGMRVKITDQAPGSGPARNTYLEARLRRLLEPYAGHVEAAQLNVEFDGVLHVGELVVRSHGGSPQMLRTKGRRMVNVLANLLDAAEARLDAAHPAVRRREQAI